MKNTTFIYLRRIYLFVAFLFIFINSFGQSAPPLGTTSGYALFTAAGAFSNIGNATVVTGDVGTNVGAFSAFPPGTLVGQRHVADPASAQAATDVAIAYSSLSEETCGAVIGTTLGNNQVLTPNVYCLGGASTINGNLFLDAQGDPNALFIIKINGALATSTLANVILINSASLCNVYWQINGAFSLGVDATFRGTALINGAISLLEGSSLYGRALSKAGAIDLHNNKVAVASQPVATITVNGNTTFCAGETVNLTASVTNGVGPFSYLWSPGGETTASITASPLFPYIYSVSVTTMNGCTPAVDTIQLNVNSIRANAGSDRKLTCDSLKITLNGSAYGQAATFNWTSSGGHFVSGMNSANPVIDAAGTYTLIVTDSGTGCTASDITVVTSDTQIPTATAGADRILTCDSAEIVLHGSGSQGTTLQWTTNNGNIVSGNNSENPVINMPGVYVVTVKNTVNGCTASDSAIVSSDTGKPNVNAGPDKELNCEVTEVTLEGSSTTPHVSFNWTAENGGEIFSGANTTTPLVKVPGKYSLQVKDSLSGCFNSDFVLVTRDTTSPDVNAGPNKVITCRSNEVTLSGSSTSKNITFYWTARGNGHIVSGANTFNPVVDAPGIYVLTVISNVYGCSQSDSTTVTTNFNPPIADAGLDSEITCKDLQIVLEGSSSTPEATFKWTASGGGNILVGSNTPNPIVDVAGSYTLVVTDPSTGCTASDLVVVMDARTLPNVDAGANATLNCTNTTANLSGSSSTSGVSFKWKAAPGGNIISGENTANPIVDQPGPYTLTVIDPSNGCEASDQTVVIEDKNPPIVNLGDDVSVCDSVIILDAGNLGSSFKWNTAEVTGTISVSASGTYSVIVTAANGCAATDSIKVTLNPSPIINLGPDSITLQACDSLVLNAGNPGSEFIWNTNETVQSIKVTTSGVFKVTVTNTFGCQANDSVKIKIKPLVDLGPDTTSCNCILLKAGAADNRYEWCNGQNYSQINACKTDIYCVKVTTTSGCVGYDTVSVTIVPAPVVNLGRDTTISSSIVLDAGISGIKYLWNTGDTTRTILVTKAGTFSVEVKNNLGCIGKDTINVNMVSDITDINSRIQPFIVYPNPNTGAFKLNFNAAQLSKAELKVFNLLGSEVYYKKLENLSRNQIEIINLEDKTDNVYILQVLINGEIYTNRITIIK